MLSIGQLSKRTGVKVPTIRYYEQTGLLDAPERSDGNQRRYSLRELERLAFIRHARDLGFSIDAIRQLLELSSETHGPCAEANRIAAEQLQSVRTRITSLQRLEVELERIATGCKDGEIGDCYVVKSLANHSFCEHDHE